jgi:hypothetical protein
VAYFDAGLEGVGGIKELGIKDEVTRVKRTRRKN